VFASLAAPPAMLITDEAIPNADEQGAGKRFLARYHAGVDELVCGKVPIKVILKSIEWLIRRRCLFEIQDQRQDSADDEHGEYQQHCYLPLQRLTLP
jgi:hypothetical protein